MLRGLYALLLCTVVGGCDLFDGGGGGNGEACSEAERQEQFDFRYELYLGDNPPVPQSCYDIIPDGTFTAYLDGSAIGDQPPTITVTLADGEPVSIEGSSCRPLFPGKLKSDLDPEDCEQVFQCGCCIFSFELELAKFNGSLRETWQIDTHGACDEPWRGREYALDPDTWKEPTDPGDKTCSDQGGLTTPSGACILPCTNNSDCAAEDKTCRWGMWCMDYCYGPGECEAGLECHQPGNIGTCDIPCDPSCPATWDCAEDGLDDGYFRCLPPNLFGPNSKGCKDCLDGCKGMPSCCSGCGCVCESQCGVCD